MRRHCCIYTVAVLDRGCCRGGGPAFICLFKILPRGVVFCNTRFGHGSLPLVSALRQSGRIGGQIRGDDTLRRTVAKFSAMRGGNKVSGKVTDNAYCKHSGPRAICPRNNSELHGQA